MENHNEKYKLQTRRFLAWWAVGIATATAAFVAVWGAIKGVDAYVTLGAVGLLEIAGFALGFYFGKKTSEE